VLEKLSLIFKGATKSTGLTNVKVSILLDNALQHFSRGGKKTFFLKKKLFNAGTVMDWGYLNPLGTELAFDFSSPLDMSKVTGK